MKTSRLSLRPQLLLNDVTRVCWRLWGISPSDDKPFEEVWRERIRFVSILEAVDTRDPRLSLTYRKPEL